MSEEQDRSEQRVNAYVRKKLAALAEEQDGDLRVTVAGLVNSECTFDIHVFRDGHWELLHSGVGAYDVRRVTYGYFVCRNQSILCGDYRKKVPLVMLRTSCIQCGREYTFPKLGPSQLAVNGYCFVSCAIAAGIASEEAFRQAEERMVYIGE